MLYNPKWNNIKEITLSAITRWLETKPADETYNVFVLEECLLGQYLRFVGVPEHAIAQKSNDLTLYREDMRHLVFGSNNNNTFGDALLRAMQMQVGPLECNIRRTKQCEVNSAIEA